MLQNIRPCMNTPHNIIYHIPVAICNEFLIAPCLWQIANLEIVLIFWQCGIGVAMLVGYDLQVQSRLPCL